MRSLGQVADAADARAAEARRERARAHALPARPRPVRRRLAARAALPRQGVGHRAATLPPARSTVALLRRFAQPTPETAHNLAIILNDLNDRGRATEPDGRSPTGKGFTGLEALLEYVFNQSQAVNMFDQNGYVLRASAFANECSPYTDAQTYKKNADKLRHCAAWVGPNQPGITTARPLRAAHAEALEGDRSARRRAREPVEPAALDYLLGP